MCCFHTCSTAVCVLPCHVKCPPGSSVSSSHCECAFIICLCRAEGELGRWQTEPEHPHEEQGNVKRSRAILPVQWLCKMLTRTEIKLLKSSDAAKVSYRSQKSSVWGSIRVNYHFLGDLNATSTSGTFSRSDLDGFSAALTQVESNPEQAVGTLHKTLFWCTSKARSMRLIPMSFTVEIWEQLDPEELQLLGSSNWPPSAPKKQSWYFLSVSRRH